MIGLRLCNCRYTRRLTERPVASDFSLKFSTISSGSDTVTRCRFFLYFVFIERPSFRDSRQEFPVPWNPNRYLWGFIASFSPNRFVSLSYILPAALKTSLFFCGFITILLIILARLTKSINILTCGAKLIYDIFKFETIFLSFFFL